jgi:HlyD family secretion protein
MRNWLTLVLLAIGALLVGLIVYSFLPKPLEVDLARAERGLLRVTVDEDGKTRIREKYIVSAPLAGRLLRIDMDPGDPVGRDSTVLAIIEPRDPDLLDARTVAQSEARVLAAEASERQVETVLEEARIEQANAEADLARIRKLAASGTLTQDELEDAESRYRLASERIRSARFQQEIAQFELQQARAALLRSRPASESPEAENAWNITIRSPIDGRVLRVFQESAAVVAAGTPLLELGDPADLEVEIDVLSSDAVKIAADTLVLLEHWGGDFPLEGRVRLVEPAGFTKISTLGVEEQRVNVIVDLTAETSQRARLGDGFRVEARIVVDQQPDALKIPASALFRTADGWALFVVEDNIARQRAVEIGLQNGIEAEIVASESGGKPPLQPGDLVVVHPSDRLTDGARVMSR